MWIPSLLAVAGLATGFVPGPRPIARSQPALVRRLRPSKARRRPRPRDTQLTLAAAAAVEPSLSGNASKLKVGILLLNLGGPEGENDVEPFLFNLFADGDIIRLPPFMSLLQKPLARIISSRRAPKSSAAYRRIGGGSPIAEYTRAQAQGIEQRLQSMGLAGAKAYVAMRYWHPFTSAALAEMEKDGVDTLVVLPLYPQFSISTTGSSLRVLREALLSESPKWGPHRLRHTVVPAWYSRPGYVKAVGALIRAEVEKFSEEERREGVHVLFSAHGVPRSYVEAGDPYMRHVTECVELMRPEYEGEGITTHLSYQSRVGPIEWLKPYTEDMIPELGAAGVKNLVVVPISFVSEHIETLEEIDIEYRELAEGSGIKRWRRVPALNTDSAFLDDLATLCLEALSEPSISITEACSQNNVDLDDTPLRRALKSDAARGQLVTAVATVPILLDVLFGKGVGYLFGVM